MWLEGLGTVAAWQQVTVRAQVDGRLDKVLFTEGQACKKGDAAGADRSAPVRRAAALGRRRARARSRAAPRRAAQPRALPRAARGKAHRAAAGRRSSARSPGRPRAPCTPTRRQIETAKLNLDYARINSPIDGVVGVRLVDPGNLVHADRRQRASSSSRSSIRSALLFTLPRGRSAASDRGDGARRRCRSRPGAATARPSSATGKLVRHRQPDQPGDGDAQAQGNLPNPDRKLWPNQFVKARLLVETRKGALVIPAAAVQRGPQGTFVYSPGRTARRSSGRSRSRINVGDLAIIGKGPDSRRERRRRGAEPAAAGLDPADARRRRRGRRSAVARARRCGQGRDREG